MQTFKQFLEKKEEKENYLDGMWRELGIDPNVIPDYIESGPIEIPEEGLWYNQAIWQVLKPIEKEDSFVRIKFCVCKSPNLNQRAYVKREDGQMVPYEGDPSGRIHMLTIDKFAELLGRGWQSALMGGAGAEMGGMGGLGGGLGI